MAVKGSTKKPQPNTDAATFDIISAKSINTSLSRLSDIRCCIIGKNGQILQECNSQKSCSPFCSLLSKHTNMPLECSKLHLTGAKQSERFGGRYIYSCPCGVTFTCSPIIIQGSFEGALCAGPVVIMDDDDLLLSNGVDSNTVSNEAYDEIKNELKEIPHKTPQYLNSLSEQLFANAVYIGDSSHELFAAQESSENQNTIGMYIQNLKDSGEYSHYPVSAEREMFNAVARGDRALANNYLNYLLGYIYFYIGDESIITARITELFVIMSRGAITGGANTSEILQLCYNFTQQLTKMKSQEEKTRWLASSLNYFTDMVFDTLEVKHTHTIHEAIEYMNDNFASAVTLEQVANHVGYSSTYFSRIFKEEVGSSFKEYLTSIRIEKSKSILMSSDLSITDISGICGFNDQSYFCKTFSKVTGVTPDKFRKRVRRIVPAKELAIKK